MQRASKHTNFATSFNAFAAEVHASISLLGPAESKAALMINALLLLTDCQPAGP